MQWKIAKLILIPKPGKEDMEDPAAYRPICLLNVVSKVNEQLIADRIKEELEITPLSDRQYGFRKGRSTIDAIDKLVEIARSETRKSKTRGLCALLTVDIKNAFNSVPWVAIHQALEDRRMSEHLRRIIGDNLNERAVKYEGTTYGMTGGVPQGSVLGPILWNITYDEMLGLGVPEGVSLIALADDLAIVAVDRSEEGLTFKVNRALEIVDGWIAGKGMEVAAAKTEAVMLVGKKRFLPLSFNLRGTEIIPVRSIKYLGVHMDRSLKFGHHVKMSIAKADKMARDTYRSSSPN